jgi:uncharacterized protein (DUF427 family)
VRAIWNGTVIAESDDTLVVEGNHYFPRDSVRWDLLEESSTRTTCGWKGQARYWSVEGDGRGGRDVAWSYPDPQPAARHVEGRVAFWRGVRVTG